MHNSINSSLSFNGSIKKPQRINASSLKKQAAMAIAIPPVSTQSCIPFNRYMDPLYCRNHAAEVNTYRHISQRLGVDSASKVMNTLRHFINFDNVRL